MRWNPIGMLQRPIARCPWSASACVTSPAGFVKSSSHAPSAPSLAVSAAMSSTTGTVRSALANPPAPVVSWPRQPNLGGIVSSSSRAASPPTRSCTRTNPAPSIGGLAIAGQLEPPGEAAVVHDAAREAADDVEPLGVDVVQPELREAQQLGARGEALDQLGGVGAARSDDGDLQFHRRAL